MYEDTEKSWYALIDDDSKECVIFLMLENWASNSTLPHKVELTDATWYGTPLLEIYFHTMRMETMPWMLFIQLSQKFIWNLSPAMDHDMGVGHEQHWLTDQHLRTTARMIDVPGS